jgi:plasmid stabilization system protein ParE
MKRYILTPRAKRDVNDNWDYIASDKIEAADRVLIALESALVNLAKNPGRGYWREELADQSRRFWLVYSYLIVYRHEAKPLQIVRALHASRDVQGLLGLLPDEL